MATSKRKHSTEAASVSDQANKRQRSGCESHETTVEPDTVQNDITMPDVLPSPIIPRLSLARKRRKVTESDGDKQQVTYLIGRRKPDQPASRRAVVNLHGRKKDVEECVAFLEKFSPSDNDGLIARLTQSPTFSVVNSLEIRSWSAGVKTPEYCADVELWEKRESQYNPPTPVVSPYPQHVSIALRYPDRQFARSEPQRVLRVPEFDDLHASLSSIRDTISAAIALGQLTASYVDARRQYVARTFNEFDDFLLIIDATKRPSYLSASTSQGIAQGLNSLLSSSPFDALFLLVIIFATSYEGSTRSDAMNMLLKNLARTDTHGQNMIFQVIARSIIKRDQDVAQTIILYAKCMLDAISQSMPAENSDLLMMKLRVSSMYSVMQERNLARLMLENVRQNFDAHQQAHAGVLAYLARACYDAGEVELAVTYLSSTLRYRAAKELDWSVLTAMYWCSLAYCYSELKIIDQACYAMRAALDIASYLNDVLRTQSYQQGLQQLEAELWADHRTKRTELVSQEKLLNLP